MLFFLFVVLLIAVIGRVTYGSPKGLKDVDTAGNMTAGHRVGGMRHHEKGHRGTGVQRHVARRRTHRRTESINPKTMSSVTGVSDSANVCPSTSTIRAVRPAGSTCNPAP